MINAYDFGFRPEGTPMENWEALQRAVDNRGEICIDRPGVYEVGATVVIHSDTHLCFGEGVVLKRVANPECAYMFVNEGAFKREYDSNIEISGLNYQCNGTGCDSRLGVYGLRGHIAFFYIKNLRINGFRCLDLTPDAYCIHVCRFENVLIENVTIEGKKDAVHFGTGRNFTVRHGYFRTFDDPIALNAHDYASANPELGWIEDGLIEDCYDLDDDTTTGFFCRILAGSWCDWHEGMEVQNSDTVVSAGALYRVWAKPDGTVYRSVTPPTHGSGMETLDGINWVKVQDNAVYNCGCRNIRFKDIHLKKHRPIAFSIHFDNDNWSRSVYPGSEMPVQQNLLFENIYVENELGYILDTVSPAENVEFRGLSAGDAKMVFTALPHCVGRYPTSTMRICEAGEELSLNIECRPGRSLSLELDGDASRLTAVGDVKVNL